jgi:glycosyltransferase involved in cell wall biosynthesis
VVTAVLEPTPSTAAPPRPTTRIRVAYCIENLGTSGGTELNAVRTMESIDRTAVDPLVIAIGPDGPMRTRYAAAGYDLRHFPIGPLWHPRTYVQLLRIAALLRRERPQIVHCNDVYTNWVCGLAARLGSGARVIASKRWTTEQDRYLPFTRIAYRLADAVLGNSELIAASAHEIEGAPREKLVVVPNFIELPAFDQLPAEQVVDWRERLGIDRDAVVIGCVQRLRAEKEHARLVRAFARLALPTRCQLVLVGDGPEEGALREQVAALPESVRDRVLLVGHLPSRPSPHQLFDISVLPARSEGFPNSLLEAMAMGRAIVSTDVGGVRDAIADGVSGLVVPASDESAMQTALQRVVDDVELRTTIGRAALARARDIYAVDRVMPRLLAVYRSLVASTA